MQLFRAHLSRFSPHPHRDSWMRNHLDEWLTLLRWSCFLTFLCAGWLCFRQLSPLGLLYPLQEKLQTWTGLEAMVIQYCIQGLGGFLALCGLLCFRCGNRYKPKYSIPVFLASSILVAISLAYCSEHGWLLLDRFLLPLAMPFLLLRYCTWKNQLDHWCICVCMLTGLTHVSIALESLSNPGLLPSFASSWVGIPVLSQSQQEVAEICSKIMAGVAILASFSLILSKSRRLGLYLTILLGALFVLSTSYSYFSTGHFAGSMACLSIIPIYLTSYWVAPWLVLLSLASQKKTQTLRF